MKRIMLTQDLSTLVDDDDYIYLNSFLWYAHKSKNIWYAQRNIIKNDKRATLSMHNVILNENFVDHIDSDGLNNQRYNLRKVTNQQNLLNQAKIAICSSKYKGVYWHKQSNRWLAQIQINKRRVYLGIFLAEIDAAKAYDKAASENFGEFARLNFACD